MMGRDSDRRHWSGSIYLPSKLASPTKGGYSRGAIRPKCGARPSNSLNAMVESGQTVLAPWLSRPAKAVIARDAATGLQVLSSGAGDSAPNKRAGSGYSVKPPARCLLDVNAFLALGFLERESHERVALWVRSRANRTDYEWLECATTELGFVLSPAPQLWTDRGSVEDAPGETQETASDAVRVQRRRSRHPGFPIRVKSGGKPPAARRSWRRHTIPLLRASTNEFLPRSSFQPGLD